MSRNTLNSFIYYTDLQLYKFKHRKPEMRGGIQKRSPTMWGAPSIFRQKNEMCPFASTVTEGSQSKNRTAWTNAALQYFCRKNTDI